MEQFKIDNFNEHYTDCTFPHFDHLTPTACRDIQSRCGVAIGVSSNSSGEEIVAEITKCQTLCMHVDAKAPNFSLEALISSLKLLKPEYVFINWYRFDDIDRLLFSNLAKHFDDIWYPAADDIDIFDASLSWILSIHHEGDVSCLRIVSG